MTITYTYFSSPSYTVQTQIESGWMNYIHTDDMDDALEWMENVSRSNGIAARVIENNEGGNVLQEIYTDAPFSINLRIDLDWRKYGF